MRRFLAPLASALALVSAPLVATPAVAGPSALQRVVVRVVPVAYARWPIVMYDGAPRLVAARAGAPLDLAVTPPPGARFPWMQYDVYFASSSGQLLYALDMTVSGPNIRVLHQGGYRGPRANYRCGPTTPWFEFTGTSPAGTVDVVTLRVTRTGYHPTVASCYGRPTSTTTTSAPPPTTSG